MVDEDPIEGFRKLPADQPFIVPDAHRPAVLEGLKEAERGQYVSDDEMTALWKKCGL